MRTLPVLASLLCLAPAARAQGGCPTRSSWPTDEWPVRSVAAEKAAEIAALEQLLFSHSGDDLDRRGARTDAFVLVHRGEIIYERYARGWKPENRHLAWSATKSYFNVLVGIATGLGVLSLDTSICDHLSGLPSDRCAIRVRHLLEWGSGLEWAEEYEGGTNQDSSVLAMLYGEGAKDMARFVANHPLAHPPGTFFRYSTGDAALLAGVLRNAMLPKHGERWPWALLFDRIGAKSVTIERDAAGTWVGGSLLYSTPRDMARFGWLVLNDGCWAGERLVPEGWLADSLRISDTIKNHSGPPLDEDESAGRAWWLNLPYEPKGVKGQYKDLPPETVSAEGHWGQTITIIKPWDLVMVRVADDREDWTDVNSFGKAAAAVAGVGGGR